MDWAPSDSPSCSSKSTTNSTNTPDTSNSPVSICPICADPTVNTHFGSLCCHACAAFFRRTIAQHRRYVCSRAHSCRLPHPGASRQMCKFCRFHRCLRNGLRLSAIYAPSPADLTDLFPDLDPILRQLVLAERATFVGRLRAQLHEQSRTETPSMSMGVDALIFEDLIFAEFTVLLQFLMHSGFGDLQMDAAELCDFAVDHFYSWLSAQIVLQTLRNAGHRSNRITLLDDSALVATRDDVVDFLRQFIGLRDPVFVAGETVSFLGDILSVVKSLQRMRPTETELAVLVQLLALKAAIRRFPDRTPLRNRLDHLFASTSEHFARNHDDVAHRMGALVLLITELEALAAAADQFVTIMTLSGYAPVRERVRAMAHQWKSADAIVSRLYPRDCPQLFNKTLKR